VQLQGDTRAASRRPRLPLLGGGEAQLVAAARAGDEQAFAAIVRRHERALRGYAAKLLRGSGLDPDDVVQEVFIRAHAALTGGDERDLALKPWLYRMTRNRVIDLLRRRGAPADSLDAGDVAAEPAAARSSEPAQALGRREALRALLADLAELPEQQRDALLMRELEGLSHESVGAQLGVTRDADARRARPREPREVGRRP
jgi:RNA polymerase sigma factor (sigma-70 family)